MATLDRARGVLFGLAIGDALGAPTEFLTVPQIVARFGPQGPATPGRVTDDTQMALAVADALLAARSAGRRLDASLFEPPLRAAFVSWLRDPENNRAPGMTCLAACERLAEGAPWLAATARNSKGCGANMRVAPVALCAELNTVERGAVAQFQAAVTHGHATALAASELTAQAIALLLGGEEIAALPSALSAYARSQREVYHHAWLGDLWQRPGVDSAEVFIARGWDECVAVLARLERALAVADRSADPCAATGEGWIAEEALATALLCVGLFPKDPRAAVHRAAVTSGDSDSIASIAGSLMGARFGAAAWPAPWRDEVEYAPRIEALAAELSGAAREPR